MLSWRKKKNINNFGLKSAFSDAMYPESASVSGQHQSDLGQVLSDLGLAAPVPDPLCIVWLN